MPGRRKVAGIDRPRLEGAHGVFAAPGDHRRARALASRATQVAEESSLRRLLHEPGDSHVVACETEAAGILVIFVEEAAAPAGIA